MDIISELKAIAGDANVLTGGDAAPLAEDWTGRYRSAPRAAVRPGSTAEVSAILRLATRTGTPVVPVSGNTGLSGGTGGADGAILLSLSRMTRIREINPRARIAVAEAGVVIETLQRRAEEEALVFPLSFGARGSAMLGGALSTNAGGANVLRYGNARDLCLGLEAVLPTGEVVDLMRALRKDNSGYDLRHLMIGAEGTLGVITAAVVRLFPAPRARATAMVALPGLDAALALLNRLQDETGGAVEAFEYMPRRYLQEYLARTPGARAPFDAMHAVNVLVEVAATAPRDAAPGPDGAVPVAAHLEAVLAERLEAGDVADAVVARSEAERAEMWARREAAAEVCLAEGRVVNNDVAVPLDRVAAFLESAGARVADLDPDAVPLVVGHLGDGNLHYAVRLGRDDDARADAVMEAVEDVVLALGGSFSAEHGIGLTKRPSMARRKDPGALAAMRAIKAALDPAGIMNPGKLLP